MKKRKALSLGLLCAILLSAGSACDGSDAKAGLLNAEYNFDTKFSFGDEEHEYNIEQNNYNIEQNNYYDTVNNQVSENSETIEENAPLSESAQSADTIEKSPSGSLEGSKTSNSFNENYNYFAVNGSENEYIFVVNCDDVFINGSKNFMIAKDCSSIILDGSKNKVCLLNSKVTNNDGSNNEIFQITEEEYDIYLSEANMALD